MAKGGNKRRNRSTRIRALDRPVVPKPANEAVEGKLRPTPEREQHNVFTNTGTTSRTAMRVVPVIDTLLKLGKLTQAEYDALKHYRDVAHQAEDDVAQSSVLDPQRMMGGSGCFSGVGKIPAHLLRHTRAIQECGELERALGSLLDIARAVAVDDVSLTRWAIHASGGVEVRRAGKVTEIKPRDPLAVDYAHMELRFAAGRIRP